MSRTARALGALLLLGASVAARPAAAQFSGGSGHWVDVDARTHSYQTNTSATDGSAKWGDMTEAWVEHPDGSQASGWADVETMSVKSRAMGATRGSYARTMSWFKTDIWFVNVGLGAATQPIQAFFHGALTFHGTRPGGWAWADMGLWVRDSDGSPIIHQYASQSAPAYDEDGNRLPSVPVASQFGRDLTIPLGYSRYSIQLGVLAEVSGQWAASFENTVNMYLPKVEGVSWHMDGTAGSKMYVPDWAQTAPPPVTTTPEPATLALLGAGALAVLGVQRRRRRAA